MPAKLQVGAQCRRGHDIVSREDIYRSPHGYQQCRACIGIAYQRKVERGQTLTMPDTKWCKGCAQELPCNVFRKSISAPTGLSYYCNECAGLRQRAKKYGVSVEEIQRMMTMTCCAICGDTAPLKIDHCHASGRIRGMLCDRCNWAIGHLRDDPDLARKVAEYLES